MRMLNVRRIAKPEPTRYAQATDFCRIFDQDVDHLYRLSLLLTGDPQQAEECFVRGLEDSVRSNRVFKEWADSWARRTLIHNAIQMIRPKPTDSASRIPRAEQTAIEPSGLAAVVALPAFERFVYVMSVLERLSDQECALLLGDTRAEVIAGRISALQQIAGTVEASGPAGAERSDPRSIFPLQPISQLTALA